MFRTIFSYAFRNIFRARMRSLLTLVSLALIIALYTILTNLGNSLSSQVNRAIDAQDVDIAVQARFATSPVQSNIVVQTVDAIAGIPEVEQVEALLVGRKLINDKTTLYVFGLSNYLTFAQRLGIHVLRGTTAVAGSNQLILGEKIAHILQLDAGDTLPLGTTEEHEITGVYSSWLSFLNLGMIVDLELGRKLTGKSGQASVLLLKLANSKNADSVINEINQAFPAMRAIHSAQLPDYLGPAKSISVFSTIVSTLTLLVGVAILINTFVMAVGERTKELGILSAIGWSKWLIVSVVQLEALLLSFAGGLAGFILSYPIILAIKNRFEFISLYLPDTPDGRSFISVMLICLVVGLTSAVFPALYGARVSTSKALRHE